MKKFGGSFGKAFTKLNISVNKLLFLWTIVWLIWGFGLLSPLTPSEGAPSLSALVGFIGLPFTLNIVGFLKSWQMSSHYDNETLMTGEMPVLNNIWPIVFFAVQTIAILSFSFYLLLVQSGAILA